jgi:L-ascorbate metabolism protein UlaG (beta-lactamase superfamily)
MRRSILLAVLLVFLFASTGGAEMDQKIDTIKTDSGDLAITFVGHGTLMFSFDGKIIHVDPWSTLADYSKMPKADIILITHHHRDHFDTAALEHIRTEETSVVLTEICAEQIEGGIVMNNGDEKTVAGISIKAVPAYNIVHMRSEGVPYHPKGEGNGYIITLGGKRIYVAGDTEDIPEMRELKDIDIAFLPMNLPYTMTPKMAAKAAKVLKPKRLYPYHYRNTETSEIVELLKDEDQIEVLIR